MIFLDSSALFIDEITLINGHSYLCSPSPCEPEPNLGKMAQALLVRYTNGHFSNVTYQTAFI